MRAAARSVLGCGLLAVTLTTAPGCGDGAGKKTEEKPFTGQTGTILFVTQVPLVGFSTISSTFANHLPAMNSVPRGGDLMIRYPDGTLRNLTREAGFGSSGMQGDNAIAVREPTVHWSGNKAVFSMVIGAPPQYEYREYLWQLYEVSGLAKGETVSITKVANQPAYNNLAPSYGSDDRILFASDRPRTGEAHLYPQLDEYESSPTTTGIYSLDPVSGDLFLVNHTASGVFGPFVDSFGRVLFTKWDHLQRDQQADAERSNPGLYGAFTYASEADGAAKNMNLDGAEVFPEPRAPDDPDAKPNLTLHKFNQFFPWQVNQDGTGEETLNHVGRHELGGSYSDGSFSDDPNLTYLTPPSTHVNRYELTSDGGLFHMKEDPKTPGTYYATYAREFGTACAGALVKFAGGPSVNPEDLSLVAVTHRDSYAQPDDPSMAPGSTGHYRNTLPMSDGTLVVSHTSVVGPAKNDGTRAAPKYNYDFRLKAMEQAGEYLQAGGALTSGIMADVSYYDPDILVTYQGPLWELDAVEVAPRTKPTPTKETIETPESNVFKAVGVDVASMQAWLKQNGLALIISRNVTSRDRADVQQPYNLSVPGGVQTKGTGKDGKIYDVPFFQIFEGDALRGYTTPAKGRRLLARPIHGDGVSTAGAGDPAGSVRVGADGSMAAIVPARRALTWQLTDATGAGVVRERNWVSFQAGEIRTCPDCHGVNKMNQAGAPSATNEPEALRSLLTAWKASH